MSAFFDSEIIKDALEDINKLQEDVYGKLVHFHMMTYDEQIDHVSKLTELLDNNELEDLFDCSNGHPLLLRKYLSGELNLEILVIFEHIFNFVKDFDKKLSDPVWETVSMKITKYTPFININVFQYKKVLR